MPSDWIVDVRARHMSRTRVAHLPPAGQEDVMKVAPSPVGREAGRGLLTLANVITVVWHRSPPTGTTRTFSTGAGLPMPLSRGGRAGHDQYAGRSQPVVVVVALD